MSDFNGFPKKTKHFYFPFLSDMAGPHAGGPDSGAAIAVEVQLKICPRKKTHYEDFKSSPLWKKVIKKDGEKDSLQTWQIVCLVFQQVDSKAFFCASAEKKLVPFGKTVRGNQI